MTLAILIKYSQYIMFADDMTLFNKEFAPRVTHAQLQHELVNWFKSSYFNINISKFTLIIIITK